MMDTTALLISIVGLVPLMVYMIYSDMKYMKIPNWLSLSVLGVFLATGSWGLPLEVFVWRLAHGGIVFGLGYLLYRFAEGRVGAGDIKLIAAFTPFIPGSHIAFILMGFAIISFLTLAAFMVARKYLHNENSTWKAFAQRSFVPAGVILGLTVMIFMAVQVADRLAAA